MKLKFIPLDFDYVDIGNSCFIRIFGRTDQGKRCCVIDKTDSYFWIIPKKDTDIEKYAEKVKKTKIEHAGREAKVLDVKIKDKKYLGKSVRALQVFVNNPKDITTIKDLVKTMPETEEKKEIDINYITRYIIDKNVKPLVWQDCAGKEILDTTYGDLNVDIVLELSEITESEKQEDFEPKILAFDIEASGFEMAKGEVLMVSLVGKNIQKVITCKKFQNAPENVIFADNEEDLLKKFKEEVKKYQPDCLVGYFSDGFDLPYMRASCDKNDIKLDLGLDKSNVAFTRGIMTTSKITGIVHIDLYKFINNTIAYILQSETLSLNDVAKELIGEEKLKLDLAEISKQLKKDDSKVDWKKYYLYNLQDSILTYKLALKMWYNLSELTKFIQEPLFHVSRSSYSQLVENYILHNLKEFNEIAPNRPTRDKILERRSRPKYEGAFVFQPEAGLYEKVAVFDFRSLYPSVIVSFNLSSASLQEDKKDAYETPEVDIGKKKQVFYFSKEKSFIPILLQRLIETRRKIKEEKKKNPSPILEARDYNLKTLSNAAYGYLGFFGARYYSIESAASAAAISRFYTQKTIETIQKKGYKVIYADTDSIMFLLGENTEKQALELLKQINESLPGTMELELEDFYKRGIFVTKRTGEFGAKKKYAMLSKNDKMKIRGFETVRRDWCNLAKEVQDKILNMILKEGNADNALVYVKEIIKEIKSKKIPKEKLIIHTQLKKAIDEYEAIGPHVVIAKRMVERAMPIDIGSMIEYIVAEGKEKDRIRDKAKMPDEIKEGGYDIHYYVHNQIMHAVGNIFEVFKVSLEELSEGKKQKNLSEF